MAWNSDTPNTAIKVHIYVNLKSTGENVGFGEATAGEFRQDLKNAGYGNGNHGFTATINWNDFAVGEYVVYVYAIGGNNPVINGCPKYYTVSGASGSLDAVNSSEIRGWAWRSSAPNRSIMVQIVWTQQSTGRSWGVEVLADKFRQDLYNAGYGNGNHAFSYAIDWNKYPVGTYTVNARGISYDNQFYLLGNCPKSYSSSTVRNKLAYVVGSNFGSGHVNTTALVSKVQNNLSSLGYSTINHTNPTRATIGGSRTGTNFKLLESEVVFISGHGNPSFIWTVESGLHVGGDGERLVNAESEPYTSVDFYGTNSNNWSNVVLAVMSGCNTGQYGDSLSVRLNWGGAKVTVGNERSVGTISCSEWYENFMSGLSAGRSVSSARTYANNESYIDSNVKFVRVEGDSTIKLTSSGTSSALKQQDVFVPDNDIIYKDESNMQDIIKVLENKYPEFNIEDCEVVANSNGKETIIDFVVKIGDFYTNSEHTVFIEEGKVNRIVNNSISFDISAVRDELEKFSLSDVQVSKYKKLARAKEEFNNDMTVNIADIGEEQTIKLFYDIKENKKYIQVVTSSKIGDGLSLIETRYEL